MRVCTNLFVESVILLLIFFSQEVAFYDGNVKEKSILTDSFNKLRDCIRSFIQFKFYEGIIDNILSKCKVIVVQL